MERRAIWGADVPADDAGPDAVKRFMEEQRPAALCLSGGGIRSAAFALGVLQALARRQLLGGFHYLSTVSGGGYIGGWLTRRIAEQGGDVAGVERELAGLNADAPASAEPESIRRLRERTNYLTPKVGVTSTDSWTAAAIVIRNLLLNWLLFAPALLLVCLAFNLYRDGVFVLVDAARNLSAWVPIALTVLALPLCYAVFEACWRLPTHATVADGMPGGHLEPPQIRRRIVAPSLVWSGLLLLVLAPGLGGAGFSSLLPASVGFFAAMAGFGFAALNVGPGSRFHFGRNVWVWATASLLASLVLAAGVRIAFELVPVPGQTPVGSPITDEQRRALANANIGLGLLVALMPLWASASHVLLSTVYAGFRRPVRQEDPAAGSARPAAELDREWLARLSAAKLQLPVLWAVLGLICLVVPWLVFDRFDEVWSWTSGAFATISGVVAVLGGRSALSSFDPGATPEQKRRRLPFDLLVAAATAVFLVALLAALARAEDMLARSLANDVPMWLSGHARWLGLDALARLFDAVPGAYPWTSETQPLAGHLLLLALLGAILWLCSSRLNVNRFSLHGLYRNRLVRSFLGAAREDGRRAPDRFTDFDGADNIRMADLWPKAQGPKDDGRPGALFPVVNMALNVTGGDRLAWQERKAMSFTVTPLACGWTDPLCKDGAARGGAYRATCSYGGREMDLGMEGSGMSLGTAITISGAAASPNMGYHSSPATALLMTLFNVRLGAWLPNPAAELSPEDMLRSSPRSALLPLAREMTGWADDREDFVYLSDGGHFDNLGLYEMVRRRCMLIVVSDAGCDPGCRYQDLGMAVRKISIDQGIRIELGKMRITSRQEAGGETIAYALGHILYKEGPKGLLLYLKPSHFGATAPIDVQAYANAFPEFPHEPTSDQWFSESQFESYRRLGEFTVDSIDPAPPASSSVSGFFDRIAGRQQPGRQAPLGDTGLTTSQPPPSDGPGPSGEPEGGIAEERGGIPRRADAR